MDTIPYLDDDFAKASEHLRLAISLLANHKIAPSPMNFRLGYDYVAGKSEELKASLDEIVGKSGELSTENLWEMYRRFFIQDDKALENMRQELRGIIVTIQSESERSGTDLSSYRKTLNRFAEILDASVPRKEMSAEVRKVLEGTRSMEQSQHQLESQMSSLLTEVDSLRKELEQVKEESLTDTLTKISNRKAFDAALEQTVHAAREHKTPFCLLLGDIDHFKPFNESYGRLVGDKVLRFAALTIQRCLQEKDMAARFGGDEFAVILPQTSLIGAEAISDQIRQAISSGELKNKDSGEGYGRLTVSIGVAQVRMNETPKDLIKRAERALKFAKERGRNRVERAA